MIDESTKFVIHIIVIDARPRGSLVIFFKHLLSVVHAIGARDRRKSLMPSRSLVKQVHTMGLVAALLKLL